MRIQKTQNTSFQAKLDFTNMADTQNLFIKDIAPTLETCGGPKITHRIESKENGLAAMVFSIFSPGNNKPKYRTFKLMSAENFNKKAEELATWIKSVMAQAQD